MTPVDIAMNEIASKISQKIYEITSDERYPKSPDQEANVFANAPLALIQMGMKGKVEAYNDVIRLTEEIKNDR